jgi:hypothetical protein
MNACHCIYCTKPYRRTPLDRAEYAAFEKLLAEHQWRAEQTRKRAFQPLPPIPEATDLPRSNPYVLTAFGKTQHFQAWANEVGMARSTIKNRILAGWAVEEALSVPPSLSNRKRSKWKGVAMTVVKK